MIPSFIKKEISQYLGSEPKPYLIPFFKENLESICEYWDLPIQKDEDKPIHIRHQEITLRIIRLFQENQNDPQIESLKKEANELLNGIPVTKRYGYSWVSINEILKFDKTKGIRKEWWDLNSRFRSSGVCIFQGYKSTEAQTTRIADILIFMPFQDQFEFLRLNHTRGNNHPIDTDRIIEALSKLDDEFGVKIIYALLDYVEFIVEKPVEPKSISRIRQRLRRLCPSAEELGEGIRAGRVALWWD